VRIEIVKTIFKMKLTYFFYLISLNVVLCTNENYDDKQIIIMLNQYFEDSSTDKLLGNHIFADNGKNIFQIEIQTDIANFNDSMVNGFMVINKLSNMAKTDFMQAIIIIHFITDSLPVIAKSDLNCSKKFFIEETQNEMQWRENCLSIQKL